MPNQNKALPFLIVVVFVIATLLMSSTSVSASFSQYPPMIFDKGINVSYVKSVVYSFPSENFNGVQSLYFTTKWNRQYSLDGYVEDNFTRGRYLANFLYYKKTNSIKLSSSRIIFYDVLNNYAALFDAVNHELEHHGCYTKFKVLDEVKKCNQKVDS